MSNLHQTPLGLVIAGTASNVVGTAAGTATTDRYGDHGIRGGP